MAFFDLQNENQHTIAAPVFLQGVGVHSGEAAFVSLNPAPANSGIGFAFLGADGSVSRIFPLQEALSVTERATSLAFGDHRIGTIEHVLSALWGSGVDNALLVVHQGKEMPFLDGSSQPFVRAIEKAGLLCLDLPRRYRRLRAPIHLKQGKAWLRATPADALHICLTIDYPHNIIGTQSVAFTYSPDFYKKHIAAARTFCTKEEFSLKDRFGLGKGATMQNTLIVGKDGIAEGQTLRMANEFATHKALDLIGDLAVLGCRLWAKIEGYKSGHALNGMLVKALRAEAEERCPEIAAQG